jgi:hypothetical protein
MTYATDTYLGDGAETEFDLTFPFISRDHVEVVFIALSDGRETPLTVIETGVPTGDEYRWENDTRIKVGTPPTSAQQIRIRRNTPEDQQIVPWSDGSYLLSEDLNTSDLQWLYGLQELEDQVESLTSQALKFKGAVDLTVDPVPALATAGDYYINTGIGTVLSSWVGIAGQSVTGGEQVIYDGILAEWTIVQTPVEQRGVLEVKGDAPIVVNSSDPQRPEVQLSTLANAPIVQTLQGSTLVSTFDINVLSSLP